MLYFLKNLRNEEQVAVIQAGTVISLCEKVSGKFLFTDTQWANIAITPCYHSKAISFKPAYLI